MFDGDPLTHPSPSEVPLPNAPLVRVIGQARFPTVLAVQQPQSSLIAALQESIRHEYPELKKEQSQNIALDPNGPPKIDSSIIWRFIDISGNWRASVASDFVALETDAYVSRRDFLDRFGRLLSAVELALSPGLTTRLGLRYIDRLDDDAVGQIGGLVRPEMLGLFGLFGQHTVRALSESVLNATEGQIQLRWGLIPRDTTFDPAAVPPISTRSWVLDIDMFGSKRRPFASSELLDQTEMFAQRIYTVFRWAVTDEFLRFYGGQS